MAELLYELWDDRDSGSQEMSPVTEKADKLRRLLSPNAVRVHSFYARSFWDASRKRYAWNGCGKCRPILGDTEDFSDEEVEELSR